MTTGHEIVSRGIPPVRGTSITLGVWVEQVSITSLCACGQSWCPNILEGITRKGIEGRLRRAFWNSEGLPPRASDRYADMIQKGNLCLHRLRAIISLPKT